MTAGNEAWWHAMVGASQFEDGSLVIQDDTLDVDGGGGTVNLLVKLGAKPRSDVTVALSEASTLISLGAASLTFTPDNWDTFQSVTVTGAGNRQSISMPSTWQFKNATQAGWLDSSRSVTIAAGLSPTGITRQFSGVFASPQGAMNLQIGPSGQHDLSDDFEANGSVTVSFSSSTYTFSLAGADPSDPYNWTPTNSADATAMYNALDAFNQQAGTLILRDFVPADATISLSASGPAEYTGVTDSATVSVN